jgi:hypothetical protein
MQLREFDPISEKVEAQEAQENLRVIRELMERSTKYSTFSGLSGVLAGLVSIVGCLIQQFLIPTLSTGSQQVAFILNWSAVVAIAIGGDYFLTKRRAPLVGKTILSRLGKQMVLAAAPGLGVGALLTLTLLQLGHLEHVYPFWMLTYGTAVSAVGLFSQREVQRLGWAFLGTGIVTLGLQAILPSSSSQIGLAMTAIAFGGFHIAYGMVVARRGGW